MVGRQKRVVPPLWTGVRHPAISLELGVVGQQKRVVPPLSGGGVLIRCLDAMLRCVGRRYFAFLLMAELHHCSPFGRGGGRHPAVSLEMEQWGGANIDLLYRNLAWSFLPDKGGGETPLSR